MCPSRSDWAAWTSAITWSRKRATLLELRSFRSRNSKRADEANDERNIYDFTNLRTSVPLVPLKVI